MATKENLDIDYLEGIIRESWCKETSTDPEHWTEENPAWGQCAVTALVVNDYCSGKLVWAQAQAGDEGYSHYFNLIDGEDMTSQGNSSHRARLFLPVWTRKKDFLQPGSMCSPMRRQFSGMRFSKRGCKTPSLH